MASSFPVFLILSACLFATIVGFDFCGMSKGEFVVCLKSSQFCCGTCDERYCCDEPQKRFTKEEQKDCLLKGFKSLQQNFSPRPSHSIPVYVSVLGLLAFVVLFLICWFSPRCWLHKRFRSPRSGMEATSVVTTQRLAQPDTPYQPLPETTPYGGQPTPTGQPYPVLGPPPSYQDAAGPGYPDGGQASNPVQPRLPTDYTLPTPPYNLAYVDSPVITSDTPAQPVQTNFQQNKVMHF